MIPFSKVSGRPVPLPIDNVDTDQIIPASFLKVVDREGLAEGLFFGWRFREDGSPDPAFVLHQPQHQGASVLLVGENFGCGSSREHAPWALQAWGFRVILGRGFADIFKNNAHRNGLLTVTLSPERHQELMDQINGDLDASITADLTEQKVTFPDGSTESFQIDSFARHCMLNGLDPLGHLLEQLPKISRYEDSRPTPVQVPAAPGASEES
jgi:3-isopropylmalate/(R)-2-methylmalate dehydratase small subunit